jgi:hypothetical protein
MTATYMSHSRFPGTLKPHIALSGLALYPKSNIDPAMQLIHLAVDPRKLIPEIDLIAQHLPSPGASAQRV